MSNIWNKIRVVKHKWTSKWTSKPSVPSVADTWNVFSGTYLCLGIEKKKEIQYIKQVKFGFKRKRRSLNCIPTTVHRRSFLPERDPSSIPGTASFYGRREFRVRIHSWNQASQDVYHSVLWGLATQRTCLVWDAWQNQALRTPAMTASEKEQPVSFV